METVDIDSDIEFDRALQNVDIQAALNITYHEATEFLREFGKKCGPKRVISQSEFAMMRLDGTAAKWVKHNCNKGVRRW